jgi:hypothetical protein
MTIGDIAEVNLLYTDSSSPDTYENVLGFKAKGSGATLANLASAFKAAVVITGAGGILRFTSNKLSSDRLTVRDVVPGTAAEVELDYTAVPGQITADMCPPQCATLVTWRTGLAGRSFRGRTFLPGLAEDRQANGTLVAAQLSEVADFVTQMLAVFGPTGSDANWQFAVISRITAGAPRTPPIATAVTAGVVQTRTGTQRRRNN